MTLRDRLRVVDGVQPDDRVEHDPDQHDRGEQREEAGDDEGQPVPRFAVVDLSEPRADRRDERAPARRELLVRGVDPRSRLIAPAYPALRTDLCLPRDDRTAIPTEHLVGGPRSRGPTVPPADSLEGSSISASYLEPG